MDKYADDKILAENSEDSFNEMVKKLVEVKDKDIACVMYTYEPNPENPDHECMISGGVVHMDDGKLAMIVHTIVSDNPGILPILLKLISRSDKRKDDDNE